MAAVGRRTFNIYRGADLRYNLEITLEQAAHGTETKIRIPTMEDASTATVPAPSPARSRNLPDL